MVEHLKAKLKLLEQLMDAIRKGLTPGDIQRILKGRSDLNRSKTKRLKNTDKFDS
jgi:hypothetical protein